VGRLYSLPTIYVIDLVRSSRNLCIPMKALSENILIYPITSKFGIFLQHASCKEGFLWIAP
jgi:hypothetical protein